jgi:hypothetical protein
MFKVQYSLAIQLFKCYSLQALDRRRTFIQQHSFGMQQMPWSQIHESSNPWMFMDIDHVDDAAVPSQQDEKPPDSAGDMH